MVGSIASAASSAAHAQGLAEGNIQVTKKVQDQQKADGEAAVSLIEAAGSVASAGPTGDHTGLHVNVKV